MKRTLAMLLALVMMLGLMAGCGGEKAPESTAPESQAPESQAPESEAPEANDWAPEDDLVIYVGAGAGGDTDANARMLAEYLSEYAGINIAITNVKGGSGLNAMEEVQGMEPDGNTAFFGHTEALIPEIADMCDYTFMDAFNIAGVCIKANTTLLCIHKDNPNYQTLPELVEYAKAHPGEVEFANSTGGYPHLIGLALEEAAGIDMNFVEVGGNNDKKTALAGQQTDVINIEYGIVKDYIDSGEFLPIALLTEERNEQFPDIPTAKEQGVDLVMGKFFYLAFAKDVPAEVVSYYEKALEEIVANPDFIADCKATYFLDATYMNSADGMDYANGVYEELNQFKEQFIAG
ncbi:MAG: tripartite tricarboxylate transporter substrate binding protein [Candidatus Heteroscillospira sp.]|jgi:tripartite-type tricarboxylate transporter receptor subunit TctC